MARLASAIAILLIAPLLTFAAAVAEAAEPDGVTISPASEGPYLWGEPMMLEGTVTEDGAPVPDATVKLTQIYSGEQPLATVVTDAAGHWTFQFTPPEPRYHVLWARYDGVTGMFEASTRFDVVKHPTTLTFSDTGLRQTDERSRSMCCCPVTVQAWPTGSCTGTCSAGVGQTVVVPARSTRP